MISAPKCAPKRSPISRGSASPADEHSRVIEGADEVGDLYINGPSAALLYWGNRAKSRETFQGAWTKSGDTYWPLTLSMSSPRPA